MSREGAVWEAGGGKRGDTVGKQQEGQAVEASSWYPEPLIESWTRQHLCMVFSNYTQLLRCTLGVRGKLAF